MKDSQNAIKIKDWSGKAFVDLKLCLFRPLVYNDFYHPSKFVSIALNVINHKRFNVKHLNK